MRSSAFALLFCTAVFSISASAESSALELAAARGCFICHSIVKAENHSLPLAPSYTEISDRYRDQKDSASYLIGRVMHGTVYSEQNWAGRVSMRFMPPNVNVSRLEAGELVDWVLHLPVDKATHQRLRQHEAMLILSTTSGCMACHRMDPSPDSRLMPLAPAFRDIAKRYAGNADAQHKLAHSIKHGTRAADKVWQDTNMQFMPPNVALTSENAQQLAEWILSLEFKKTR